MPNRRTPRKPEQRTAQEHSRIATPRLLDGASPVPAATGQRAAPLPLDMAVAFANDEFPMTAGASSVTLTKYPDEASIHIFQCTPIYGFALLEDIHWTRAEGSNTIQFLAHVQIAEGDVIVAHYVYNRTA